MNTNKTKTPVKKTGAGLALTKNSVPPRTVTPTPGKSSNGYTPKYTPPAEPMVLPAPNVEVDLPRVMEIVTLEDLVHRITANASILTPGVPIKVTTAITASDKFYHALIVTPKNTARETSRWKVEIKGPAVNIERLGDTQGRRKALEALLELLEKKIGKELFG